MKCKIILWLLGIIFLPLGLCLLYNALTGSLQSDLNTALSLYLSLVGIMVTVFLTWYVYRIERRREEKAAAREERDAKRTVSALLRAGIAQTIFRAGAYVQISDEIMRLVMPASRSLSLERMASLTTAMKTLQSIGDTELREDRWEAGEAAESFAGAFLPAPFSMFRERMLEVANWEWLVEEPVRGLLEALGAPLADRPEVCADAGGRPIFQSLGEDRFRLWDRDGHLVLDATVRDGDVVEGYAELNINSDHYYCGHFEDGDFHGWGTEYFARADGCMVSREGEWAQGELVNGMIYQAVLDDLPEPEEADEPAYKRSPYEWLHQYPDPGWVKANVEYMPPFRMCNVRVTGGVLQVIEESIQTVEEFCENWRPRVVATPRPIGVWHE